MATVRRRLQVRGRVQGVGFRASCARVADQLGLSGRVRNRADGTVEVVVQGESAAVDRLVSWCRSGPPGAAVAGVDVSDEPVQSGGTGSFAVG